MKKKKVIVVIGPTASGKSALALKIAQKYGGYLISADSRMVYQGMDIGTNKDPGVWQRRGLKKVFLVKGVEEYLIDVVKPGQEFTVDDWLKMTKKIIKQQKDKLPIVVGGTGLYTTALVENYQFNGNYDKRLMVKLNKDLGNYGLTYLVKQLISLDPEIDQKIDINNPRRVVRALSDLMSKTKNKQIKSRPEYDFLVLGVNLPREILYKKINDRVDEQVHSGLLIEAKKYYKKSLKPDLPALTGIGYRQFFPYFEGRIPLTDAIENLKKDTRHYAKRQMTWYRKYAKQAKWVKDFSQAEKYLKKFL